MSYHIIDEPKPRMYENLILDPVIILFLSIIVPLFWNPPMAGKFWIPLLWLISNGFLLGSPTLRREIGFAFGGAVLLFITFYGLGVAISNEFKQAVPYLIIILHGILFLTLYMIVFAQTSAYGIHEYLKRQRKNNEL